MKKLKNTRGFTLVESLAALMVLVLLVVGMDSGMKAATRAYTQSIFESNSAALSGILNTAMGDILRYSEDVTTESTENLTVPADPGFVFTNYEYGVKNAYLQPAPQENRVVLKVISLEAGTPAVELVNTGAYPRLTLKDFRISYHKPTASGGQGTAGTGYYEISYTVQDVKRAELSREVKFSVRQLNSAS